MGDLEDIIPCFTPTLKDKGKPTSCNALIKATDEGDLIVGHTTFNIFSLMLRVYKTYDFALHDVGVLSNISFSSRPGDLESKDDFILLSGTNMVVVETSLNNWNPKNYDFIHYNSIPTVTINKTILITISGLG